MRELELRLAGRVEDGHLDRAWRAEIPIGGEPHGTRHRRVVQLHIAEVQARTVRRGEATIDAVHLGEGEGEGLLDEDRQSSVERRIDRRGMRARGQDRDGIQTGRHQQLLDRAESTFRRDAIPLADGRREAGREVGDSVDRVRVAQPLDQRQVDGLGDGAEPGDPEAHTVGRPAGRWLGGHRAEYIEGPG